MINKLKAVFSRNRLITITTIIFISFLICADTYSLYDMFIKNGATQNAALFFASVFAVILEGGPFFVSNSIAVYKDKTCVRKNERFNALWGVVIGSVLTLAAFTVVVYTRYHVIDSGGGIDINGFYHSGFNKFNRYDSEGNILYNAFYDGYSLDLFLMFSPILTSMLAFLISWMAFKPNNRKKLHNEMTGKYEAYLDATEGVKRTEGSLMDIVLKIQTKLKIEKRPEDVAAFKEMCLDIMRKMMADEVDYYYPILLQGFTDNINAELNKYILDLSMLSNISNVIRDIDIAGNIALLLPQWDLENSQAGMCETFKKAAAQAVFQAEMDVNNNIFKSQEVSI